MAFQLAHGPGALDGFDFIKGAFEGIGEGDEEFEMGERDSGEELVAGDVWFGEICQQILVILGRGE